MGFHPICGLLSSIQQVFKGLSWRSLELFFCVAFLFSRILPHSFQSPEPLNSDFWEFVLSTQCNLPALLRIPPPGVHSAVCLQAESQCSLRDRPVCFSVLSCTLSSFPVYGQRVHLITYSIMTRRRPLVVSLFSFPNFHYKIIQIE